jgi:dimethylaniline monooxygenase (N-oxide forming)
MKKAIERDDRRMRKRYVASKRHTIQVDFYPYMRTIKKERARRKRGIRLQLPQERRAQWQS